MWTQCFFRFNTKKTRYICKMKEASNCLNVLSDCMVKIFDQYVPPLPPHTLKIHPLICVESFVDADTVMNFTRVLFLQQFRGKSSKIFIQNLKLHYNHYLSTINHYITIIRLKRGKAKKNKLKYERSHGVHPLLHSQKLHLSTTRKTNNSKRKQNSTAVLN